MNQKLFRGLTLAVCVLSFVAVGQQPSARARRGGGGGLDNLSLPSTTARVSAATTGAGEWQMFTPEGAGFSVLLPGIPEDPTQMGREQGTANPLLRVYRLAVGGVKY